MVASGDKATHTHKNTAFPFTSLKCPQVFWQSIVSSSSSDTYCSLRVNDFKMCYLWYNMRSGGHLLESHMATLTSLHWAYVISQFDWEQSGEKPAHECASQHCRNLLSLHWHPAQMEMDNWWGYNHHHFFFATLIIALSYMYTHLYIISNVLVHSCFWDASSGGAAVMNNLKQGKWTLAKF